MVRRHGGEGIQVLMMVALASSVLGASAASEGEVPPAPQELTAEPGPGLRAVTLRWLPVEGYDVDEYRIYMGDQVFVVGADQDADPWDEGFTFVHRNIDVAFDFFGLVAAATTPSYRVTAVNAAGEGPPSEQVSMTPFLACADEFCVGLHITDRRCCLVPLLEHAAPVADARVSTEIGRLRVEVAGTYVEQLIVVPRGEAFPVMPAETSFPGGSIRYSSPPFGGPEFRLAASTSPEANSHQVSLDFGRFWVYLGNEKTTDIPFAMVQPFMRDGSQGVATPGFEAVAVAAALASAGLFLRRRR